MARGPASLPPPLLEAQRSAELATGWVRLVAGPLGRRRSSGVPAHRGEGQAAEGQSCRVGHGAGIRLE